MLLIMTCCRLHLTDEDASISTPTGVDQGGSLLRAEAMGSGSSIHVDGDVPSESSVGLSASNSTFRGKQRLLPTDSTCPCPGKVLEVGAVKQQHDPF